MTREEAIQILSTRDAHGVLCGYTSGVPEALDMAIEALSEPKTGWIPVSEKLPDKEKLVLVTDNDSIEFGKLICGLFGGLWLIWVDDCWTEAIKVTAWMPLPEPYKGETNGKM